MKDGSGRSGKLLVLGGGAFVLSMAAIVYVQLFLVSSRRLASAEDPALAKEGWRKLPSGTALEKAKALTFTGDSYLALTPEGELISGAPGGEERLVGEPRGVETVFSTDERIFAGGADEQGAWFLELTGGGLGARTAVGCIPGAAATTGDGSVALACRDFARLLIGGRGVPFEPFGVEPPHPPLGDGEGITRMTAGLDVTPTGKFATSGVVQTAAGTVYAAYAVVGRGAAPVLSPIADVERVLDTWVAANANVQLLVLTRDGDSFRPRIDVSTSEGRDFKPGVPGDRCRPETPLLANGRFLSKTAAIVLCNGEVFLSSDEGQPFVREAPLAAGGRVVKLAAGKLRAVAYFEGKPPLLLRAKKKAWATK